MQRKEEDIISNVESFKDSWFLTTASRNETSLNFYFNSDLDISKNIQNGLVLTSKNLNIGHMMGITPFNGIIDEVRISRIPKSDNWIKRSYMQSLSKINSEED